MRFCAKKFTTTGGYVFSKLISALALLGMQTAFLPEFAAAQSRAARLPMRQPLPRVQANDRSGGSGPIDPSPIPAFWTCTGNCGTDGADGVVTLSPTGNAAYEWVSTSGGT